MGVGLLVEECLADGLGEIGDGIWVFILEMLLGWSCIAILSSLTIVFSLCVFHEVINALIDESVLAYVTLNLRVIN